MTHHLAQLNIARMRFPLDDLGMKGFVDQLEPVNALADAASGFVWRLQTEDGDATSIRAFDDDMLLINMSLWESIEALREFVYRSNHLGVLRDRASWFDRMDEPHMVLWWEPAGRVPTIHEAKDRLQHLRSSGPSQCAFTFKETFPAA
ncbi:MAG TPA: DUF3291 domain-containing protein [Acidimicrobiia bacterium]|jgi:hypothetical protein